MEHDTKEECNEEPDCVAAVHFTTLYKETKGVRISLLRPHKYETMKLPYTHYTQSAVSIALDTSIWKRCFLCTGYNRRKDATREAPTPLE